MWRSSSVSLRSANDERPRGGIQYGQAFGALYTLGEIRVKLGHTPARCADEGRLRCEWGRLPAAAVELPYIDQLFVEFHLCAPSPRATRRTLDARMADSRLPPRRAAQRDEPALDASALRGAVDAHRLLSTHFRSALVVLLRLPSDQNRTLDALVEAGATAARAAPPTCSSAAPSPRRCPRSRKPSCCTARTARGLSRAWIVTVFEHRRFWRRNYSGIGEGQRQRQGGGP